MAEIYRDIGSLKELKKELLKNNINDFHSVKELNTFIYEYPNAIAKIELEQKENLEKELIEKQNKFHTETEFYNQKLEERTENLKIEKIYLENEYNKLKNKSFSLLSFFKDKYRRHRIIKRLNILRNDYQSELEKPYIKLRNILNQLRKEIDYINTNFQKILSERTKENILKLNKTKQVIENLYPLIAGVIGEQKALTELKKLEDEYSIINDVYIEFKKPIFNSQTKDYIYSIQIDHLVVSKSGIFVIETKNWSKKSIDNLDLFSPVNQIKRSSFALFVTIHNAIENKIIKLKNHHWGVKKIPIKNILLLVGEKPKGEFQFVKLLTLNEIIGYIKYFEPVLDDTDVKILTNYINRIVDNKITLIN